MTVTEEGPRGGNYLLPLLPFERFLYRMLSELREMLANWRRSVNFPGISRANVLRNSNFSMLPKIQRCGRKMKDRGPRFGIASTKIQRLAHRAYRVEALLDVAQGVHGEVAGAGPLGLLPLVREGMMPRWRHYHFFSRDVLEEKSEKTKIAWPKNAQPKKCNIIS